ncbi:hypothetical protein NIES4071_14680 [Calothrix sp. NIES-4071]|nr:hypothetical protein NIES4071_14680 [Calothrix sp. NIES-4071]BAZ55805.1 hypothetical protein NIES4105_14630 [Calothrix sp. NIES-4105]
MERKLIHWRRNWLCHTVVSLSFVAIATLGMLGILGSIAPTSYASTISQAPNIIVYRSPECSCCGGWIKHLKTQGFSVQDFPTSDIEAVKQRYKVPDNLTSCHTAMINGYVIEGHVPANDIKRLLQEKSNVSGLSVPNMPVGTPGMEMGNRKDSFNVVSFNDKNAVAVFNHYAS